MRQTHQIFHQHLAYPVRQWDHREKSLYYIESRSLSSYVSVHGGMWDALYKTKKSSLKNQDFSMNGWDFIIQVVQISQEKCLWKLLPRWNSPNVPVRSAFSARKKGNWESEFVGSSPDILIASSTFSKSYLTFYSFQQFYSSNKNF